MAIFRPDSVRYRYRAFGLRIDSVLSFPQLPVCEDGDDPDVTIDYGSVVETASSRRGYRRKQMLDQFRYEIIDGGRVTIELLPACSIKNVSDLVLSRVLTAVVYQRGLLPLHASAVWWNDRLIAVCGPSGAGKSTLAAAMAQRGGLVVADDILVLGGGGVATWPGANTLKLSLGTLTALGRSADGLTLANEVEGKYHLPVPTPQADHPAALAMLIRLRPGPVNFRRLSRLEALSEWANCVRMTDLIGEAPDPNALRQQWLDLTAEVDFLTVSHGRDMRALVGILDWIEGPMSNRTHVSGGLNG